MAEQTKIRLTRIGVSSSVLGRAVGEGIRSRDHAEEEEQEEKTASHD